MTIVRRVGNHAIAKLDKGEGFEASDKYMVILNYDESKEYCGIDGDIYKSTLKEAIESAHNWY